MCPSGYSDRYFILTVERLTKTLIVTTHGTFERRNGGSERLGGPYLLELTPEIRVKAMRRRYIERLRDVKWDDMTDEQLQRAWSAVKPAAESSK